MRRPTWSVAQLMSGIAIFSVSMAALLAILPSRVIDDPGVRVLTVPLALVLTIGADRAFFARSRAFWLGFTAAGWLIAIAALVNLQETRRIILKYGPPLVRAREEFVRQHMLYQRAQTAGVDLPFPDTPGINLFGSMLAETGIGIAVGILAASVSGLLAVLMMLIVRRIRLLSGA